MRKTVATSIMLAAIVTGCTVGPDYEGTDVTSPRDFRFQSDETIGSVDVAWWNLFEDEALDDLIEEALRNNYDIRIAAGRVKEFAARVGITRSAAFPQVDYNGTAQRDQASQEFPGRGGPNDDRITDFFNANLNVGWELDLWGRIRRATEAARADLLNAEETRRGVILTLVTAVATSYVALRSLDEQLIIAERTLESRAETLELFKLQLSKGVISQLEVAQVQTEYERTAARIPAIQRDIAKLENSLSVLLGRAPGPIDRGTSITELTLPPIPQGLPADLLRRRPDLRASEQSLIAANARVGQAMADFFPTVSLTGVFGAASDDLSNIAMDSAGLYNIAANVAGPIFTAGRLEGQLDAAEAIERQAFDQYVLSVLTAFREAEDSLVTRTTTQREIEAQTRQVQALLTYSGLARQKYDNGYVGYLEVLDAERDLFDAELDAIRLLASLHLSAIGIYKAFGGGWVIEAETTADEAHAARRAAEEEGAADAGASDD